MLQNARCLWHIVLFSLLTLPVEFLTHPLTPLPAQLPNPTWVTDICTLESNLKNILCSYTNLKYKLPEKCLYHSKNI